MEVILSNVVNELEHNLFDYCNRKVLHAQLKLNKNKRTLFQLIYLSQYLEDKSIFIKLLQMIYFVDSRSNETYKNII